mmetsp:Transcript_8226/g.6130  ORF Transcript_8226/g.6130 Transcript_8226/m.6130 type:complete len:88 (+) Transcript_8226:376-639(+)
MNQQGYFNLEVLNHMHLMEKPAVSDMKKLSFQNLWRHKKVAVLDEQVKQIVHGVNAKIEKNEGDLTQLDTQMEQLRKKSRELEEAMS